MSDRGYSNLLNHLNRSSTTLPIQTIQASIAYYLAHVHPSPTPLAATVIGSPLFRPFSNAKLVAASTAFRHALHVKVKLFQDEEKSVNSVFLRNLSARIGEWVKGVMKGIQGGQAMMRVVCYGGLLTGLEDFEATLKVREGRLRGRLEDEVVLALAEVMDLYSASRDSADWENEFHHDTDEGEVNAIALAFIMASQVLPLVSTERLTALPLPMFLSSLLSAIASGFQDGKFLRNVDSIPVHNVNDNHLVGSRSLMSLKTLTSSPVYQSMGPLTRLYARTISAAVDSRNGQLWSVMHDTLMRMENMANGLETDWQNNPVLDITDVNDVDLSIRETMTTVWTILKTFLFATVMITQSITTAMTYLPSTSTSTPPSMALTILHTLSRLSVVISQFGGVTSMTGEGFSELKRVFYSAVDVLSVDAMVSQEFVVELCSRASVKSRVMENAKNAFALACIEQLVSTLDESIIEQTVFPFSLPHLSDPSHRETYESAHSVVLAIFALHAQRAGDGSGAVKPEGKGYERPFAERIVPYYTQCLIENSYDGKLVTAQLRLAYAALVRSAGSSGSQLGDALAWFCIQSLLDAAKSISTTEQRERVHKLQLSLVSTLSSLPIKLLPRVLEEVKGFILSQGDKSKKEELVQAVLKEILEKVGDREKVLVMEWWMDNEDNFERELLVQNTSGSNVEIAHARL